MKDRVVRRQLASGKIKAYRYGPRNPGPVTVDDIVTSYLQSAQFRRLKEGTRKNYRVFLDIIRDRYGSSAIADIRRRNLLEMQDAMTARPSMANRVIRIWSVLFGYAMDREHILMSPLSRPIPPLPIGEHRRWTQGEIDYAIRHLPEWAGRAVVLALYTGQRLGDCLAMRWADFDGSGIKVTQQKTGVTVWVPAHTTLKAALATWKKTAKGMTILTHRTGRPIQPATFSTMFSVLTNKHCVLEGLAFHGLRKSAAARLAEAGCTTHEIAAITGHKNLAMVQHYTAEVDQKTNATAAILKLERKTPR